VIAHFGFEGLEGEAQSADGRVGFGHFIGNQLGLFSYDLETNADIFADNSTEKHRKRSKI
jgi:hypothetical protein